MLLKPAQRIKGRTCLPGDKSISHRAALIAALAKGTSILSNFSTSEDCASTLSCLAQLAVSIERDQNNKVRIQRPGALANGSISKPVNPLDCGNSGSTMRLLSGILAGQEFNSILTGDQSLRTRPMKRVIEPLQMMGARVLSDHGHAPLRIEGQKVLRPIKYELPVASAQVKSCVLLAGLHAEGRTEVVERLGQTRDHTERMLEWFGVPVEIAQTDNGATACAVVGPAHFDGRELRIPGDFSSAAFFIAAATLLPGSELQIDGVGLNPTRIQLLETLSSLGAKIEILNAVDHCNEPVGTIRIYGNELLQPAQHGKSNTISGPMVAALIDELPLLAVIGTQVSGGLVIRDATELRHKETDRIAATVKNLRAMGAEVEEYDDGLAVAGRTDLRGASLTSEGDHRIAMAFSIAALLAEGDSEIQGAECIGISFPEFFELLESVVER
jgi:3-phosphoshikimate 1-carboxyvinyltransferase